MMRLLDAVPRQPTTADVVACDAEIELWTGRRREAEPGSAWAHTCAGVIAQWTDLRAELAAAVGSGCPPRATLSLDGGRLT